MAMPHHALRITVCRDGRRWRPVVYDRVAYEAAGGSRHLGPGLSDPAIRFVGSAEADSDRYIDAARDGRPFVRSAAAEPQPAVRTRVAASGQITAIFDWPAP